MCPQRVIVYIDGFNLYYAMRRRQWSKYFWLNIEALAKDFLTKDQELVGVRYFTARISRPETKNVNQTTYLEALETLPLVSIIYGHFKGEDNLCRHCGHSVGLKEKMTDVNISVYMVQDTLDDLCDLAILLTGNSDQVPTIDLIRKVSKNSKRVAVAFPPDKYRSNLLSEKADFSFKITENKLRRNQLPAQLPNVRGFVLHKPEKWS